MKIVRWLAGLAAAACLVQPGLATAQTWPAKPIRLIVPFAAGSGSDILARILAEIAARSLGQPIVVENQPGAAGLIGAERVAKSAPDGYTLGAFNDSVMTMLPNLHEKMPWDTLRDFAPVSLVGTIEWGLVVSNDAPYRSAADLIAAARANPGRINYGSGGNGSPQHIAMALFASTAGISLTHVPYKGATQAALDVAAGQVPVAFQGLATVATLARGGKLRLVGVSMPQRHPQFPEVPTISESGLPGFEFNSWFAIMVPAGTPKDIVARLHGEIVRALGDADVREKLQAQGLTPRGSTPEELRKATADQLEKYGRLFRQAGISAD